MTTQDAIKYFESYLESAKNDGIGIPSEEPFLIAIAALQEKLRNDELRQKGLLVELPCAVGEDVYRIVEMGTYEVYTIVHEGHRYSREVPYLGIWPCEFNLKLMEEFGKTVFLTREEAQAALDEKREE